jgi:polysaccharide pyruvyl transferase WcaK-like protein
LEDKKTENFYGYKQLKILHIAAFEGNIGDNASHVGFYNILDSILDDYSINKIDIRRSYKKYDGDDKLFFDEEFVFTANQYDLVVFGGGGFLDYWVEDSSNGTTIDIEVNVLKKIKTEILITSIGCNPHRHVPKENFHKFKMFLDYVNEAKNIQIAVRNDGSVNSIKTDFGKKYLQGVVEILDHAYFYSPKNLNFLPIGESYVSLNITEDQLGMINGIEGDRAWYFDEIENLVGSLSKLGFKTVFVPHIHQDVEAIAEIIGRLPSQLARSQTIVAPCLQSDYGADIIFSIYRGSKYVIGSRYHANVCSINLGVPTIGLSPLPRIGYTHSQINSPETSLPIKKGFSECVINIINSHNFNSKKTNALISENKSATIDFYKNYFCV